MGAVTLAAFARKEGRIGMLRAILALFCVALVVAAVAPSSAEPIREGSYVAQRNLIFDEEGQDWELLIEEPEQDAENPGNRAKRSPVFPGFDVFQVGAFKKAKKLKKKKVKKFIKASPFLATKFVKKKVKLAPPLAFGGAFAGALAAVPAVGAAGFGGPLVGAIAPLVTGGLGGGAASAAIPTLVGSAVDLVGPGLAGLVGAAGR